MGLERREGLPPLSFSLFVQTHIQRAQGLLGRDVGRSANCPREYAEVWLSDSLVRLPLALDAEEVGAGKNYNAQDLPFPLLTRPLPFHHYLWGVDHEEGGGGGGGGGGEKE